MSSVCVCVCVISCLALVAWRDAQLGRPSPAGSATSRAMNLGELDLSLQLERMKESFLWAAAKGGREEEVESLLSIGADVNWVSNEGDTALIAACRNGHRGVAALLLAHGGDAVSYTHLTLPTILLV